MTPEKFEKYRELRKSSPHAQYPASGIIMDEWFADFLRDGPEKWQFTDMVSEAHISSEFMYAIWAIK